MSHLGAWSPRVLAAVRIITALLFVEHGLMKLVAFPAAVPGLPSPLPGILVAAAVIEIVGGALIVVGLLPVSPRSSAPARWRRPTSCFTRRTASGRRSIRATPRSCSA